MAPGKPVLGYWKIRGICNDIRMLLEYVGQEYEEKRYAIGPEPDFDKSDWLKEKFKLGLPFPNLPYYIDHDVKLSQSVAIIRYIAKKHGLAGDAANAHNFEMVDNHLLDVHWKIIMICYGPDFEKNYDVFKSNIPPAIKMISDFLGEKKWLFTELTYVDFMLYELLAVCCALIPESLKDFPTLKQLMNRFEGIDKIKSYMESSKFIKYPFHGPMAKLG